MLLPNKQPFLKMDQPKPLFHLFMSFRTENSSSQRDSNLDHWSRRQERWPLDHHRNPQETTFHCRSFKSRLLNPESPV